MARSGIVLLGYKLRNGKVKRLPEKILTIKNIAVPDWRRKLRQFLRRVTFYSRLVKNFNDITALPLKLLNKTKFS